MKDYRILITLDYEPTLSFYPKHVTSKKEALESDIQAVLDGFISDFDLLGYGDCLDYEVVEVETCD